jgi:hypothetical protein
MRQVVIAGMLLMGFIFYACGGGGGDSTLTSGSVALFATDDMSSHKQVITTIRKVQLVQQGKDGISCDLLSTPVSLDIANLSSTLHLLNVLNCPSGSYNKIHLEFDKAVKLMDQDDEIATCSFTSYKDILSHSNLLTCDKAICSLDMNNAVNVIGNFDNKLALDFDLKEFEVSNFPSENCSVTTMVSPLNTSQIDYKKITGYKEKISGFIVSLNTYANNFTISKGNKTFTVSYSRVSQNNIDQILQFAVNNNLAVKVESSDVDFNSSTCNASAVLIKVGGSISNLNFSNHTFTLTYQDSKTISVDFSSAFTNDRLKGQLSNNMSVTAKLNSYDGKAYSAYQVTLTDSITED